MIGIEMLHVTFLYVSQHVFIHRLCNTVMPQCEKDMTCHNKLAALTLEEQTKEFDLCQSRSIHSIEFYEFAPIRLITKITT
jgi:hypothetical protein